MSVIVSDPGGLVSESAPSKRAEFLTVTALVLSTWTGLRVASVSVADVVLGAAIASYGWSGVKWASASLPAAVVVPVAVLVAGDVVPGGFDSERSGMGVALSLVAAFLLIRLATSMGGASMRRLGVLFVVSAHVNATVAVASAALGRTFGLPGVAEFADRQPGLASHPNQLALVCVLGLGLSAMGASWCRSLRSATAGVLLLVGGIAVSGSRAGALAAVVVVMMAAAAQGSRSSRRRWLTATSVAGGTLMLLVGLRVSVVDRGLRLSEWATANVAESDASRREVMNSSLTAFKDHPLFGAGSDFLLTAHNSVVQVLAAGGVVLLLSLLPLLASAVPDLDRGSLGSASAPSVAVVGWLVFGLFQNALTDRFLLLVVALAALPRLFPSSTDGARIARSEAFRVVGANGRLAAVVLLSVATLGAASLVSRSSAGAQATRQSAHLPDCSDGSFRVLTESPPETNEDLEPSVQPRGSEGGCRLELIAVPSDLDGDGRADRSVWRPETGAWFVEGEATEYLGLPSDLPVPGDYDGDGAAEPAVFRDGAWFIAGSPTGYLGATGDVPVPGDYDGDGDWDLAVFRDGAWFVDGAAAAFLGTVGDRPVPGDYDGDGAVERAVFRPATGAWFIEGRTPVFFGLPTDVPVPADYDGDGDSDISVYRPAVGGWFVDGAATEFIGASSDVPMPADYDGDGATDRGIYRPQVRGWYVQGQPPAFFALASR